MSRRIGWIGLGKMGQPMALNLCRHGHEVSVWNRSAGRSAALAEAGAAVAGSIADLAGAVEVLFVSVSDDAALREVTLGEAGAVARLRPGAVLVETSTVSIAASRELARACAAGDVAYLRAPVSGSVHLAREGKLGMLVSGPAAAFEALRPLLELMTAKQIHVGEEEQARALKLSLNMMVGLSAAMLGEAMAFSMKNGVARDVLLDGIAASVVCSPLVGYKLAALRSRDFTPAFSVGQIAKDFDLALSAGQEADVPMPMTALIRQGWAAMIANGEAEADFFKYTEMALAMAGIDET
jgi:3-hydroxyisobutyrate dehydrogenase